MTDLLQAAILRLMRSCAPLEDLQALLGTGTLTKQGQCLEIDAGSRRVLIHRTSAATVITWQGQQLERTGAGAHWLVLVSSPKNRCVFNDTGVTLKEQAQALAQAMQWQ